MLILPRVDDWSCVLPLILVFTMALCASTFHSVSRVLMLGCSGPGIMQFVAYVFVV